MSGDLSYAYSKMVGVISRPPELRTDHEVSLMSAWFRKKSELFRDLSDAILQDIVRYCRFQQFSVNDLIIKQGDRGDSFYTIIAGSVGIYVASNDLEDDGEGALHNDEDFPSGDGKPALGTYIRSLGAGKSFGEVALIDERNLRGASVIAEEVSDMIVVDRNLYTRSLKAAHKKDLAERISFVEKHPLFGKWKPKYKNYMAMGLARRTYRYGNHIGREGEPIRKITFILSGQALVTVDRAAGRRTESLDGRSDVRSGRRTRGEIRERFDSQSSRSRRDTMVEICIIGQRGVVGDIEAVCTLPEYVHTVICTEPVAALEMDMRSFNKLVMRRHAQTVAKIRTAVVFKMRSRLERKRDVEVPLYRSLLKKLDTAVDHDHTLHFPRVKKNTSLTMSRNAAKSHGHGLSVYYNFKEDSQRRKTSTRHVHDVNGGHGRVTHVKDPKITRTSRTKNNESQKRTKIERDVRQGNQSQGSGLHKPVHEENGIELEDQLSTEKKASSRGKGRHKSDKETENSGETVKEARTNPRVKKGAPKIKWILPIDASVDKEHRTSDYTDVRKTNADAKSPEASISSRDNHLPNNEQSVTQECSATRLPHIQKHSSQGDTIFVTERIQKDGPVPRVIGPSHSHSSSSDNNRLHGNKAKQVESDLDVISEGTDVLDDTSANDEVDTDDNSEINKDDGENRTVSAMRSESRIKNSHVGTNSMTPISQEDIRLMTYETFLTVSSEIKEFLIKVIADARDFEKGHYAGVAPRRRPINPALPRFLDVSARVSRGTVFPDNKPRSHRSAGHDPSQYVTHRSGYQHTSKIECERSAKFHRRGRSKSEGDLNELARHEESAGDHTLPPLTKSRGHHNPHPKNHSGVVDVRLKYGQKLTPSYLELIYRRFGKMKKAGPKRQYTMEEYKQLKEVLRMEQKRFIRYQMAL